MQEYFITEQTKNHQKLETDQKRYFSSNKM